MRLRALSPPHKGPSGGHSRDGAYVKALRDLGQGEAFGFLGFDFRIGHASRCVAYVWDWVEKRVRRHLMGARHRPGFGWKRGSTEWFQEALGLYADYRVQHLGHT